MSAEIWRRTGFELCVVGIFYAGPSAIAVIAPPSGRTSVWILYLALQIGLILLGVILMLRHPDEQRRGWDRYMPVRTIQQSTNRYPIGLLLVAVGFNSLLHDLLDIIFDWMSPPALILWSEPITLIKLVSAPILIIAGLALMRVGIRYTTPNSNKEKTDLNGGERSSEGQKDGT